MPLINYDDLIPIHASLNYPTPMDMINHFNDTHYFGPNMVRHMADLYARLQIKVNIGTSITPNWNCKLEGTVICSCKKKPPGDLFTMLKELRQLNSKGKVMMSVVTEYLMFKTKINNLNRKCCTEFHYSNLPLFLFYWANNKPIPDIGKPTEGVWSATSPIVIPMKNHNHVTVDWGDGNLPIGYNAHELVISPDLESGDYEVKIYPHVNTTFSFDYENENYVYKDKDWIHARNQLKKITKFGLSIIDEGSFYECEEFDK